MSEKSTPLTAIKVTTTVPESGELTVAVPFAVGQTVEIFVIAEPSALFEGTWERIATPDSTVAAAEIPDAIKALAEDESVNPRHVSEALRELSDELITRYETLFRVARQSNDSEKPNP